MGTGWAVGAAATLGLGAALAMLGGAGLPFFLAPFVFGAWAYAVSIASYGSKGALAALAGHAAVAFSVGALRLAGCLPGLSCSIPQAILSGLVALVGAATLAATLGEIRRRRGPVQWGTAAFLLAPLAVALLVHVAVSLA